MATNITVDESVTVVNVDGSTSVSSGSTIITIANNQGPQGATGPAGPTGPVSTTPGPTGPVSAVTGALPISVATGTTTPAISIADATTTVKGAVQLTDSISSTSTTTAATPNSVKTAYDLANGKASLTGATFTGAIIATDITDSTMTTAGVVTNSSAGLFGTATILPATTGGTGVGFPDRILIAKGAQNTTVTGSATGGTMTSAFGAVTPQYVTLEASSTYFFDAYLPIAKASSTASGQWQVSVMYLDASSGATISPTSMVVTAQVWSTTASETGATIVATNTATSLGTATTSAVTRYLRVNGTIVTSSTVPKISVGFGQSQNALSGFPTTNNNSISVYKLTSATALGGAWQS